MDTLKKIKECILREDAKELNRLLAGLIDVALTDEEGKGILDYLFNSYAYLWKNEADLIEVQQILISKGISSKTEASKLPSVIEKIMFYNYTLLFENFLIMDVNKDMLLPESHKTIVECAIQNSEYHPELLEIALKGGASTDRFRRKTESEIPEGPSNTPFRGASDDPSIKKKKLNYLSQAAEYYKSTALELLLKYGADVNQRNSDGKTALFYSRLNNGGTMNILIKKGANVNAVDEYGNSFLMLLGESAYETDLIETLLRAGADINLKNKRGETVMEFARRNRSPQILKFFERYIKNPDIISEHLIPEKLDNISYYPGTKSLRTANIVGYISLGDFKLCMKTLFYPEGGIRTSFVKEYAGTDMQVYSQSRIYFYPSGKLMSCKVSEGTMKQGYKLSTHQYIDFYESGKLKAGCLADEGTFIKLNEQGELVSKINVYDKLEGKEHFWQEGRYGCSVDKKEIVSWIDDGRGGTGGGTTFREFLEGEFEQVISGDMGNYVYEAMTELVKGFYSDISDVQTEGFSFGYKDTHPDKRNFNV